jgi:hypothetical protein
LKFWWISMRMKWLHVRSLSSSNQVWKISEGTDRRPIASSISDSKHGLPLSPSPGLID